MLVLQPRLYTERLPTILNVKKWLVSQYFLNDNYLNDVTEWFKTIAAYFFVNRKRETEVSKSKMCEVNNDM